MIWWNKIITGIMKVIPRNPHQLPDTIISAWTKISEECFEDLHKCMHWRIKAVLKAKSQLYYQVVPNKIRIECSGKHESLSHFSEKKKTSSFSCGLNACLVLLKYYFKLQFWCLYLRKESKWFFHHIEESLFMHFSAAFTDTHILMGKC